MCFWFTQNLKFLLQGFNGSPVMYFLFFLERPASLGRNYFPPMVEIEKGEK